MPECTQNSTTMHPCIAVLVAYWRYNKVVSLIPREHTENSTEILGLTRLLYNIRSPFVRIPQKIKKSQTLVPTLFYLVFSGKRGMTRNDVPRERVTNPPSLRPNPSKEKESQTLVPTLFYLVFSGKRGIRTPGTL